MHRPVQGPVKTIQVKRHGRRWMLVLSCDDVPTNPLPATGRRPASTSALRVSRPPATVSTSTIRAGARGRRQAGYRAAAAGPRHTRLTQPRPQAADWLPGTAKSPISARTFTTNKPVVSSHASTCWWWRTCRSPTCCGGPNPCPTLDNAGQYLANVPGRSPGSRSISDAGWGRFVSVLRASGRCWAYLD